MDLNKIHYFFRAAELQNFTKAAQACHIAQTTMSKYIAVLEHELGVSLFVRNHKTAVLTPQGERYYKEMKKTRSNIRICARIFFGIPIKNCGSEWSLQIMRIFRYCVLLRKNFPRSPCIFLLLKGKSFCRIWNITDWML